MCVAGDIPEPCWFVETNEKEVAGIMNAVFQKLKSQLSSIKCRWHMHLESSVVSIPVFFACFTANYCNFASFKAHVLYDSFHQIDFPPFFIPDRHA